MPPGRRRRAQYSDVGRGRHGVVAHEAVPVGPRQEDPVPGAAVAAARQHRCGKPPRAFRHGASRPTGYGLWPVPMACGLWPVAYSL